MNWKSKENANSEIQKWNVDYVIISINVIKYIKCI